MTHGLWERELSDPRDERLKSVGGPVMHLILSAVVLCALQGCAHRGRPPECKGPYTPINQSLVASSDDTQR